MGATQEGRPRVVVAVPRPDVRSETFVRAHLEHLPARTLLLHGRDPKRLRVGDRALVGSVTRGALEILGRPGTGLGRRAGERALARWLVRERVDAVLAEYGSTGGRVAAACERARVPLVTHFHGHDAFASDVLARNALAYRRMFGSAAALVVVSRPMREQLEALGAPAQKLRLVPCGVDVTRLKPADPQAALPRFVAVGRFVPKKSPRTTLRAFAALLERRPDCTLEMVGDGPLLPGCRALAAELGIAHAVSFRDGLSHDRVLALLSEARGFVHHAVRAEDGDCEGTPVALLEASGSGLPVVSTRHGGIPDAVREGETGFLVEEGDVQGTTECLLRLAGDGELAGRLGRAGRDFVAGHHSLERRIAELWEVIEAAIRTRVRAPDSPAGSSPAA